MNSNNIRPYKEEFDYSYTSGAYATIEMLKANPIVVRAVYIHSKYAGIENIDGFCREKGIPVLYNDRVFERINRKENTYVLGVFRKYFCRLMTNRPHIVLVNPSDMGNLGTVIRTMAGLNMHDLAVVTPAADIFHPKTIRASMGALFHIRFQCFDSFDAYKKAFPDHVCFPFTPEGKISLNRRNCPRVPLFSLLFGNEASGLPAQCRSTGTSVTIPQSSLVDSLNLSVAAGIGIFIFAEKNELI
ncbi:MAG: TrmH family RNA methyltransferase [Parabacteroides sp.]|nr:TrmH family RNA methyltransferase [Parabacteroides sp.]